jgi:hypothetical protein
MQIRCVVVDVFQEVPQSSQRVLMLVYVRNQTIVVFVADIRMFMVMDRVLAVVSGVII